MPGSGELDPTGASMRKKSRTNTPWTPAEEQRLKTMRDAGQSWSEIAKVSALYSPLQSYGRQLVLS